MSGLGTLYTNDPPNTCCAKCLHLWDRGASHPQVPSGPWKHCSHLGVLALLAEVSAYGASEVLKIIRGITSLPSTQPLRPFGGTLSLALYERSLFPDDQEAFGRRQQISTFLLQ